MNSRTFSVLVVDDEAQILRMLRVVLSGAGYKVSTAATAEDALDQLALAIPDLVVLDLMLPDKSGVEVTRELRAWGSSVPIIVVSALGEERDKVAALDAGADDYLTKPFNTNELLARLRVWQRRSASSSSAPPDSIIARGDLVIDLARHTVTRAGVALSLTPKEFAMLTYLARNARRVLTHRTLLSEIWGAEYVDAPQYLHVLINHLRRKLEPEPSRPRYILTEPGIGYRFAEE